jgi:hypothetical protein
MNCQATFVGLYETSVAQPEHTPILPPQSKKYNPLQKSFPPTKSPVRPSQAFDPFGQFRKFFPV